jgi:hypothetical protein
MIYRDIYIKFNMGIHLADYVGHSSHFTSALTRLHSALFALATAHAAQAYLRLVMIQTCSPANQMNTGGDDKNRVERSDKLSKRHRCVIDLSKGVFGSCETILR